ncbi:MAG: rifampicin phosphotransferase [Cyanobacteriota bacterium erpe_2018_sw_21hr_WHONDRS-SW48-000092_B_bin.40]|nr:rifampicin phosphotransferase [Cyanobacteriota bacterium erpe_2018_sw_21hr_WHONDRS-SW48-000092_B_bin.40]
MIFTIEQLLKLDDHELNFVAGGKGRNLVELVRHGLPVPPFYIVSAKALESAYLRHWGANLATDIKNNLSDLAERIRQSAQSAQLNLELLASDNYHLGASNSLAVRSSAQGEDGEKSFAGQLVSFLNVPQEQLLDKIFQVFASGFERRVLAYRKLNRLGDAVIPSVVVQKMIAADSAGVIFSHDPVNGDSFDKRNALVAITSGLADKLVNGEIDGTTIYLSRQTNALHTANVLLSTAQMERLLTLLGQCEKIFTSPQDIEFAAAAGEIYLLQARAITTVKPKSGRQDKVVEITRVFDGSNIQESYPGITSPLTFSFINSAYQEVYKSFCRLMGVNEKTIQAEADLFSTMLSYIDGRVYYNLASWYRLMALLPAYKTNRTFMEGMMGLSQSAREVSSFEKSEEAAKITLGDRLNTVKAISCIASNYLSLNSQIKDFNTRLDLALSDCQLESMSLDQLYQQYRNLQVSLLSNWQAPVTNDFFAMVLFGVLKKLADKEDNQYIYNLILQNHGGIVSAAPPKLIAEIAALIASDKELCQAMISRNQPLAMQLLQSHKEARLLYSDYLELFGDRSIGELKLETKSVKDDPSVLLNTIGSLALSYSQPASEALEKPVNNKLKNLSSSKSLGRQLLIKLVAGQTKESLANRENLRFARTRVFGRVRKIVQTMGLRLREQNCIDIMEDVFYLTIEELLGFIDGTAVSSNLKALIALRREEQAHFPQIAAERLVLVGASGLRKSNLFVSKEKAEIGGQKLGLKGLGASAGVVVGRARVILNPESEMLQPGEILVADRTDPGWIVHFATCAAIIVAHGSLLSHTAIVARELGIAAVVSCKGALEQIRTGDLIEVNGSTGVVTVLSSPELELSKEENNAVPA